MEGAGVRQLEQWKKDGVFRDYQIQATSFAGEQVGHFDVAVLLDFAAFAGAARWKQGDRRLPGGVSAEPSSPGGIATTTIPYPIAPAAAAPPAPSPARSLLC